MDVTFTEEQEMLRASARDFLDNELTESAKKEIESGSLGYSPELWKKIADLGWLGLVYPEKYGGSEMNLVDLAVLFEEMGRAGLTGPYMSTIVLCGLTILEAGNDEQKATVLPEITEGRSITSLVLSEPGSGREGISWRPESVRVTAAAEGNDYLVNGARLFVHDANIADRFLVPARTDTSGKPGEGITLFLVDTESPGISIARLATTAGDNQCEVIFNNVRATADSIIGGLNDGWTPLSRSINAGTVMLAAQMLGAGQKLLEASVEDYENRVQSGTSLGVEEYNEEYITNLRRDIESCRRTIYQAAEKLAAGESCDFEMSIIERWSKYKS